MVGALYFWQIVHCDLALRNIMVNKFPWEVKLGEFGLARDMTRMTSRRSNQWRNTQVKRQARMRAGSHIVGIIIENNFEILFV